MTGVYQGSPVDRKFDFAALLALLTLEQTRRSVDLYPHTAPGDDSQIIATMSYRNGMARCIGDVDLSLAPAIASPLITSVTSPTEVTVDDATGLSEGATLRGWDTSAAAELGDVTITERDGNDLTLSAALTGVAADDQLFRVDDMQTFTLGDSSRDFSLTAGIRAVFNGSGIMLSLLGAAVDASLLMPFRFAVERTAIAQFGSGLTIPDTADSGVVLHSADWDNLYAGIGAGVRAAGASTYQAANRRASLWIPGVSGALPSTRRAIVLHQHVGVVRAAAPPANQQAYAGASAGGHDADEERLSIQLLGAGVSCLLTGIETTTIAES